MKPQTAILKLRLRLNKIASSDYDNIPDYVAVEAINKAGLERTRRTLSGKNQTQDGAEETTKRIDDLSFLLKPVTLKGRNNNEFFESNKIPDDYLAYSRVVPKASKQDCQHVPLKSYFVEEANIPTLMNDWSFQPSFKWRQSLHTFVGLKIRVYTNNDFDVNEVDLLYYRKPIPMDIAGYEHVDGTPSTNRDLEFKDDIAELILDEAAAIIAGDIESINQAQITKARATEND